MKCAQRETSSGERGIVLVVAMLGLLMMTLLGLAITTMGIVSTDIATNEWENTETFYIADAGITHAKAIIFAQGSTSDATVFLQAGNGVACDGDELSGAPVGPITSIASGGHLFPPGGRYEVRVCDDDESGLIPPDSDPNTDKNGRFRVISMGFGRNGSVSAVELIVSSASAPALLAAGNLRLNGVPEFQGQSGWVHTNGQLELDSNPRAEHSFDSSGTVTSIGTPETGPPPAYPDIPPELNSGQDPVKVPELQLSDLQPLADYNLGNDGLIRDPATTVIGDATGGPWNDWSWDPGGQRWVAGTNIPWAHIMPRATLTSRGIRVTQSPLLRLP